MKLITKHLEGRKLSSLMAIYFRSADGTVSKPMSVIIPAFDDEWIELGADGCGKISFSSTFCERLFYDAALGYSFIAPLVMAMGDGFDGSETILQINLTENDMLTKVSLATSGDKSFDMRFEDDDLYIDHA